MSGLNGISSAKHFAYWLPSLFGPAGLTGRTTVLLLPKERNEFLRKEMNIYLYIGYHPPRGFKFQINFDSALCFYSELVQVANGWRGHVTLHMRDSTVKNKNNNNSPESEANTECLVGVSLLFSSLPGSATRGLLMLLPEPLGERVVVNLQLCDLENNKRSNRGVGSVTCPHFKERPTQ